MTLAQLPRFKEYQADGVTTAFPIPFQFFDTTDVEVYTLAAGIETIVSTGRTITGGNGSTGTCTFTTAPAIAAGVVGVRARTPIKQSEEYPNGGTFPSETAERGYDRAAAIDQEQQDQIDGNAARTPMVPKGVTAPQIIDLSGIDNALMLFKDGKLQVLDKAAYAGKFIGGDATGSPTPLSGTGNDAAFRTDMANGGDNLVGLNGGGSLRDALEAGRPIGTVADLVALSPAAGSLFRTSGYTASGDGGAATYRIEAAPAVAGPGDHECANGAIARLQNDGVNPVFQFGVIGDGVTDDTDALAAAAASEIYGAGVRRINLGDDDTKVFLASDTLLFDLVRVIIVGAGTIKRADGVIVNTDADHGNFKGIIRVQGAPSVDFRGTWGTDGNRDGQTYPATSSSPGRGTKPFRHNADIEICPGSDNATRSSNVRISIGTCKNAYLNNVALWQVDHVVIRDTTFRDATWNGIAGTNCTDTDITENIFDRAGASDEFPTTQNIGDRAGWQFRELEKTFTAASEGLPTIADANGAINDGIRAYRNQLTQCGVEGGYMRACINSYMRNNTSRDVGYKRLASAGAYNPAHFWAEGGQTDIDDNLCFMSAIQAGDQTPDGIRLDNLDGDASANYALISYKRASCQRNRIVSAADASGDPQALHHRALYVSANINCNGNFADGCETYGAECANASSYPSTNTVPHDVSFDGCTFNNINLVATTNTAAVHVLRFGTVTAGEVKNVSAVNVNLNQDVDALKFNSNLSTYAKINIAYGDGLPFSRYFETPEIAITAGNKVQSAHGLAGIPRSVDCFLRCTSADGTHAYALAVEIHGIPTPAVTVSADATYLTTIIGTGGITLGNRAAGSEGASFTASSANYAAVVRAYL